MIGAAGFEMSWATIDGATDDIDQVDFTVKITAELIDSEEFNQDDKLTASLCWNDSNECLVMERNPGEEENASSIANFVVNSEAWRTWS